MLRRMMKNTTLTKIMSSLSQRLVILYIFLVSEVRRQYFRYNHRSSSADLFCQRVHAGSLSCHKCDMAFLHWTLAEKVIEPQPFKKSLRKAKLTSLKKNDRQPSSASSFRLCWCNRMTSFFSMLELTYALKLKKNMPLHKNAFYLPTLTLYTR